MLVSDLSCTAPGFFKRMVINGLLKVVKMFKGNSIQNVQFVEMEEVFKVVPEKSRPNYSLSAAEKITRVKAFVNQRLSMFPLQIGANNCLAQFA